jgi:hypothetical protein
VYQLATKVFENEVDSALYHHLQTNVMDTITSIPAGGESFTVYGDHWFQGRERFAGLSNSEDYDEAEQLARDFDKIVGAKISSSNHYEDNLWQMGLWDTAKTSIVAQNLASASRFKPSLAAGHSVFISTLCNNRCHRFDGKPLDMMRGWRLTRPFQNSSYGGLCDSLLFERYSHNRLACLALSST